MNTELYKAIKAIDIENLDESDILELLRLFIITQNVLIRDHIAFIFSDLRFNEAVPFIIDRINERGAFNNNGSLVYALDNLDTEKYFISIVKIICNHEFEARIQAYYIVEKNIYAISDEVRKEALKILEECRIREDQSDSDKGENSRLHFIEKTQELLNAGR